MDILLGEPNFSYTVLPWHSLLYWYCVDGLRRDSPKFANSLVAPQGAELWAAAVRYEDLWKIRSPLHHVEGFKMAHFDSIIMSACDVSDSNVEPHPLWEYPCRAKSKPAKIMEFDFSQRVPEGNVERDVFLKLEDFFGNVNGLALWMVWKFDGDVIVSGGPASPVVVGETIDWDVHSKQGVMFFKNPELCQKGLDRIEGRVTFKPSEGDIVFDFPLAN